MQDEENIFPFELIIKGTPLSLQSENRPRRQRWINRVGQEAREKRDELFPMYFLDNRALCATIYYFCAAPMEGDVDNIVKPILDGLEKVLYPNDRLLERVLVQKKKPGIIRAFIDPSSTLLEAIDADPPIIYVRIDDHQDWRTI